MGTSSPYFYDSPLMTLEVTPRRGLEMGRTRSTCTSSLRSTRSSGHCSVSALPHCAIPKCVSSKALHTNSQLSLDEVLQAAVHIKPPSMDRYEIIPEVTTYQALGKWLVEHDSLEERVPKSLRPYLDYRSIGADYCSTHEGGFLSAGYVGIRMDAAEQILEEQGTLHLTLATAESWYFLKVDILPQQPDDLPSAHPCMERDQQEGPCSGILYTAEKQIAFFRCQSNLFLRPLTTGLQHTADGGFCDQAVLYSSAENTAQVDQHLGL